MSSSSNLTQKCSVYVVEPHPVAAEHLAAILRRNPAIEIIFSGINLPTEATLSEKSSVVIVDAGALPFPLVPYLRTLRTLVADANILVIGKRASDDELCRLLFRGVKGFVSYNDVDGQLGSAVDTLFRGHAWVSPQVLDRYLMMSSALPSRERYGQGDFSPREGEIIALLQRRLSDKEISSVLGISEHTVRFHLQNIFNKIGAHDRYSVIEWARTTGPVGPGNATKTDQCAFGRWQVSTRVLAKSRVAGY